MLGAWRHYPLREALAPEQAGGGSTAPRRLAGCAWGLTDEPETGVLVVEGVGCSSKHYRRGCHVLQSFHVRRAGAAEIILRGPLDHIDCDLEAAENLLG